MPKSVRSSSSSVREKLEKHYRDMQDMEFTIERGTLYMLQTRTGKRSPSAAFRIAVDMVGEKLIKVEEALERIAPEDVERLFYPITRSEARHARNLPAGKSPKGSMPFLARLWEERYSPRTTPRSGPGAAKG